MKGLKGVIALILIFSVLFTNITLSFASSPENAGLVMPTEIEKTNNKYLNEYKDNYYLDMAKYNIVKNPEGVLNNAANTLFSAQKTLGYFLVVLFYYSFEFDLFKLFKNELGAIQKNLKKTLFDELSTVAISLLGFFFLIKMIKDQRTEIWIAIIQVVAIVALSTFFMLKPVEFLSGIDNVAKGLSQKVLAGTYEGSGAGTPQTAVIAATNEIWQVFVHTPWQILEFGDVKAAKQNEDKILKLAPDSDARKDVIKDLAGSKKYFTPSWGYQRLGFMLLYTIPLTVKGILMMLLCVFQLAYQVLTIIFSLLGPFVFLVALIPFFGMRLFQNWLMKLFAFQGIRVVVSLVIAIVCVFDSVLFTLAKDYGWLIVLILQLIVALIIFWKHEEFIGLFTRLRLATTAPHVAGRDIMRKDVNIENSLMKKGFLKNSTQDNSDAYNDTMKAVETTSYRNDKTLKDIPNETNKNLKSGGKSKPQNTVSSNMQNREQDNFKNLMDEAETLLEHQYISQKEAAIAKSNKLGKEVEYPEFVRKADAREKLGAPKFEQRDVIAVANELKRIKQTGADPKDLLKQPELKQVEISRPKEINVANQNDTNVLNEQDMMRKELKEYSNEYVDEFNGKYKKNYKPVFMENLIQKHGKENVRNALDTMDRINSKQEIENPSGYLLTVLKNNDTEKGKETIRPKNIGGIETTPKDDITVNNTNMFNEKIDIVENNENIIPKLSSLEGPNNSSSDRENIIKSDKVIKDEISNPGNFKIDRTDAANLEMGKVEPIRNNEIKQDSQQFTYDLMDRQDQSMKVSEKLEQIQKDIKKEALNKEEIFEGIKENISVSEINESQKINPKLDMENIKSQIDNDIKAKVSKEENQNIDIKTIKKDLGNNLQMRKDNKGQ